MKLSIEQSMIYDVLYDKIQKLQEKYNPCQACFENGKFYCRRDKEQEQNGCCGGCKNLSPTGCTVKSLMCKMWTCYEINRCSDPKINEFLREIKKINKIVKRYNIPIGFRMGKEEAFNLYETFGESDIDLTRKNWHRDKVNLKLLKKEGEINA